jgi:hypothetical protein
MALIFGHSDGLTLTATFDLPHLCRGSGHVLGRKPLWVDECERVRKKREYGRLGVSVFEHRSGRVHTWSYVGGD